MLDTFYRVVLLMCSHKADKHSVSIMVSQYHDSIYGSKIGVLELASSRKRLRAAIIMTTGIG